MHLLLQILYIDLFINDWRITMKNVLILSGSPRKGGNSDILCDEFLRGAEESGNKVTKDKCRQQKDCSMSCVLLLS